MVKTSHTVVEAAREEVGSGDEIRGRLPRPHSKLPYSGSSLNLATLRRDGFVSLDAIYPEGSAVTKLVTFTGRHLELNADAENGCIRVEIVDAHGVPIAGFTKEDCMPFRADDVRGMVKWKTGDSLHGLADTAVRFVFHIQAAKLYTFRVV